MEVNPNPNFVNLNLYSRGITPERDNKHEDAITSLAMNFIFPPVSGSPLFGRVSLK